MASQCLAVQHIFAERWTPRDCVEAFVKQVEAWLLGVCGGLVPVGDGRTTRSSSRSSGGIATVSSSGNLTGNERGGVKMADLSAAWSGGVQPVSADAGEPTKECLIVYHVAKSAGMSLLAWMLQEDLSVWAYYGRPLGRRASTAAFSSTHPLDSGHLLGPPLDADVYMGHFAIWTNDQKDGGAAYQRQWARYGLSVPPDETFPAFLRSRGMARRCGQMTMLRDPHERLASHLFFARPQALAQGVPQGDIRH